MRTLAGRIEEAAGGDNGRQIADRLTKAGFTISPQAVYKWLAGGHVSDAALEAFAKEYRANIAWLKYAEGDKSEPIAEVVDGLPEDNRTQVLDFLAYTITRSALPPQTTARYLALIDRSRHDPKKKHGKGKR